MCVARLASRVRPRLLRQSSQAGFARVAGSNAGAGRGTGRPGVLRIASAGRVALNSVPTQPVFPMPTAIILLKVDHAKVTGTAEAILDMPDVTEVYSISGRYDIMAIVKCDSIDKIESVITDHLLKIEGIVDSETMFAFRSLEKREGGRLIDVD